MVPILWKLCLQAPNQKRGIVEISPNATVQELASLAAGHFNVDIDNPDASSSNSNIKKKKKNIILKIAGTIPARGLVNPQQTLEAAGVTNQDRIIVEWLLCNSNNSNAETDQHHPTPSTPPESSLLPPRRSKRAAAQQATESMPALIAAQDAADSVAIQSSCSINNKNKTNNVAAVKRRRKAPSQLVSTHFAALETPARRLKDGQVIATNKSLIKNKKRSNNNMINTTNESLEEGLIQARKGWREAVNSAYEQNRAVARLAAKDIHYQLVEQQGTTTTTSQLRVTFEKGIQGRGVFTDTVDFIPRDALQAAIATSEALEEGLRPTNLALLSPRVFWAVRYHFPAETVEASLQLIAPDRDWSFLRRRKQQLSEKARENLRQEQEQQQEDYPNTATHWEAAAAAIAAVEDAMANSYKTPSVTMLSHGTRRWSAVVMEEWRIVTPTDQDEDELIECITNGNVKANSSVEQQVAIQRIVEQLLCQNVHNWRELANCDATELSRTLLLEPSSSSSIDTVREWMDYARMQTSDEIMVEICDGNTDAVEALRDTAHSGTPRDMAFWTPIVSSLHEIVPQYEMAQLERWCFRAQASLDQLPWLSEFVTPIVD